MIYMCQTYTILYLDKNLNFQHLCRAHYNEVNITIFSKKEVHYARYH